MDDSTLAFILSLILGILVLLMGRRLFWLYVGVMGFALGWVIGALATGGSAGWITVVAAVGAGIVFAVVAIIIQKPAAAVAGFIALGGTAVALLATWTDPGTAAAWAVFGSVGVLGGIAAWLLFTPALVVFTSLSGAAGITQAIGDRVLSSDLVLAIIFGALFVVGVVVQTATLPRGKGGRGPESPPGEPLPAPVPVGAPPHAPSISAEAELPLAPEDEGPVVDASPSTTAADHAGPPDAADTQPEDGGK